MKSTVGALIVAAMTTAASAQAFECSSAEVGYFATFNVKPGSEAEYEKQALALTDQVRALEPGVVFYAPYKGDEPDVYYFVERYRDAAARQAHASAEQIRALFGKLMPLLREPVKVTPIRALCP